MFLKRKYATAAKVIMIPISEVLPNPTQPRKIMSADSVQELARSIEQNGLISPIVVRKVGGDFILVAGQRRLAAFTLLGRESIPSIVADIGDTEASVQALVENIQRQSLNFFEEAVAIKGIMSQGSMTQLQVAERLGLSQPTVANKLRLLRFTEESVALMIGYGLTERHARALLPLCSDSRINNVITSVNDRKLSVVQTETLVAALTAEQANNKRKAKSPIIRSLRIFTNTINNAISVMTNSGIDATTEKDEDGDWITYTIKINKNSDVKNNAKIIPPH